MADQPKDSNTPTTPENASHTPENSAASSAAAPPRSPQPNPQPQPPRPPHSQPQPPQSQPQSPRPPQHIVVQSPAIPPHLLAQIIAQFQTGQQLMLPGIVQQQAVHWQGPYPPPEAVERYERVLPGTFNRLITMAEQLQAAQIVQSNKALDYTHSTNTRGQWLGFVATALAMIGALGCVALGQPLVAGAFLSVPVLAVAKALVETVKRPTGKDIIQAATEAAAPAEPPAKTQEDIPTQQSPKAGS